MEQLQVIEQQEVLGQDFKIYGDFENPLFLAKDVAEWIEHNKPSEMTNNVDEDEKLMAIISHSGQKRNMWFLTEDGLYEVLMQSRKPIAKSFKKEVKKILKEIRRTGSFGVQKQLPGSYKEALLQLVEQVEQNEQLQLENTIQSQKIGELQPKADYVDEILKSKDALTVTQIAADYGLTAQRLNKILNEHKVQRKVRGQWVLLREYHGKGYTKSETKEYPRSNGDTGISVQTVWTQKGRLMIHELLTSLGIDAMYNDLSNQEDE